MTLSGNITAAALRADFDALTSAIDASGEQDGDFTVPLYLASLADTADVSLRSIAFTPTDDYEVRGLYLRVTDGTASRVVTATLTVDNDDTSYLLDKTLSVSVTTVVGTADSRPTSLDLRTVTGDRLRLVKGVRYRLTMENTSAGTTVTGPLQAMLQLRGRTRGADSFVVTVPRRFVDGGNLDADAVNENIRAIESDVARAIARRTSRSFGVYELNGVAGADAAVLRTIPFRLLAAAPADGLVVERFEVVLYATAGQTWAVTPDDARVPTLTIDTAGTTTEARATIDRPYPTASDVADESVVLSMTSAGPSTITRGYVVIHYAHDRHGGDPPVAAVEDVDAATADVVASINASLLSLATANSDDGANLATRFEVYTARAVAGSSVTFRSPGGVKTGVACQAWAVGPAAHTARVAVGGNNVDVATTGSANLVYNDGTYSLAVNDDPTDTADDTQIVISRQAGASPIDLVIAVVRWTP